MSWDARAERIAAKAAADVAAAQAEAIRAETAAKSSEATGKREAEAKERDRARKAEQRAARKAALAAHGDKVVPVLAVGAPAVIAWSGQYRFAVETMHLGVLSPLLPIALEGSVMYSAMLTHRAVDAGLPTGRYRALTWLLAGAAAAMNFAHGREVNNQVGLALALTSLLSIVLLEMTTALRAGRKSGTNAAALRRGLIRRLRYPMLSVQAASIAAARSISTDEAWRAAWLDRYGVGPEASRVERKAARTALGEQRTAMRSAAKSGALVLSDGTLTRTETAPGTVLEPTAEPTEAAPEPSGETSAQTAPPAQAAAPKVRAARGPRTGRKSAPRTGRTATDEELTARLADLIAAGKVPADVSAREVKRVLNVGDVRAARIRAAALATDLAAAA